MSVKKVAKYYFSDFFTVSVRHILCSELVILNVISKVKEYRVLMVKSG